MCLRYSPPIQMITCHAIDHKHCDCCSDGSSNNNNSNNKNNNNHSDSLSSLPLVQRRTTTEVIALCSESDRCVDKQLDLVGCLINEAVAARELDDQLALDARSLAVQLAAAAAAKDRTTVKLFNVTEQLNSAFHEHRIAVIAAEAAARAVARQRKFVRNARVCVDHIRGLLAEAKSEAAAEGANSRLNDVPQDSGLFADGCRPDEQQLGFAATPAEPYRP